MVMTSSLLVPIPPYVPTLARKFLSLSFRSVRWVSVSIGFGVGSERNLLLLGTLCSML